MLPDIIKLRNICRVKPNGSHDTMGSNLPGKKIILSFFLCISVFGALAQKPLVTSAQKSSLDEMAAKLTTIYSANYQKALTIAPQKNWFTRKQTQDGSLIALQRVTDLGFPIYYKTYNNTTAAATTRTSTVQPGGALGLNLSGSSALLNNRLAMWDGGSVYTAHQEFSGKTITLRNSTAAVDQHATHVAGTMIAKGVYAPAKGMAFNATTLQSYDFNSDIAEITAAASGLLLSNHSYGVLAGWNYDDGLGSLLILLIISLVITTANPEA
jgi:hypothetical protein